jgi:uncharacterized membrane protein YfhO
MHYPDWKAYIDGKKAKIHKADNSFRAVEVPTGSHTIEMKYQSDGFRAGGIVSIVSLVLGVVLIIIFRKDN